MVTEQKSSFVEQLDAALDEIRPHLMVDGGNIEIVDIDEQLNLRLRWVGNCEFCTMSSMTMKAGVEQTLRSKFPELQNISAINNMA